MSLISRAIGQIGGKSCRPTNTITQRTDKNNNPLYDSKTNQPLESHFMRFTMYCEMPNMPKVQDENGRMRTYREPVQVILPDTPRFRKVFNYLESGRHVMAYGEETVEPRMKDGVLYKNIKIRASDIKLLDSPRQFQQERAIRDQVSAGIMTKEEGDTLIKKMNEYYETLTEGAEATRVVINKIGDNKPAETSDDPDVPDFGDEPSE